MKRAITAPAAVAVARRAWSPPPPPRRRREHYPVIVPAVPLRGVAADVASRQGVLDSVTGPKVLVGHSYGGLLISELAARTADVRALVYAAAFIPEAGETAGQLNAQSRARSSARRRRTRWARTCS